MISVLRSKGRTMSTAESCTGGLIGASITDIPGASEVYLGGVVSYSNDAKENILGVSHSTLLEHGAVRVFGSDYSVAVTGIAGPGGATETKPVGLVYISVADGPRTVVTRNVFNGDRQAVRESTVREACSLLIDMVEGRL